MKRLSKRGIRKGSECWNEEVARLMTNKKDMYKRWLQNRCTKENFGYISTESFIYTTEKLLSQSAALKALNDPTVHAPLKLIS